jgi:hypothetical protein
MRIFLGCVVAVGLGLACSSSRALAQYLVVNAPTTKRGPADADLIDRGTHAFFRYLTACSHRDLPALKKTVTEDSVLEYPLKKWGTYLSVGAKGVGSYCDIAPGKANSRSIRISDQHSRRIARQLRAEIISARKDGTNYRTHCAARNTPGRYLANLRFFRDPQRPAATNRAPRVGIRREVIA